MLFFHKLLSNSFSHFLLFFLGGQKQEVVFSHQFRFSTELSFCDGIFLNLQICKQSFVLCQNLISLEFCSVDEAESFAKVLGNGGFFQTTGNGKNGGQKTKIEQSIFFL